MSFLNLWNKLKVPLLTIVRDWLQKTEWICSRIKIKWDDSRHQSTRAIPNIFQNSVRRVVVSAKSKPKFKYKIGHDLLLWIWWYLPTWPISILTCDNVSNTFWKICKAKFDALPDLVCGYIISSEIHWHQLWEADQTLFIESNKFSSNLKF